MAGRSNKHAIKAQVQESSGEHPGWSKSKTATKQGGQQSFVQQTSKAEYEDKVTGSSECHTATEYSRKLTLENSANHVRVTDEQQKSSTEKISDKSGNAMCHHYEQKIEQVNYDNSGNTSCGKNKYY